MITASSFNAPWWLSNPHLQTVWPVLFRRHPHLNCRRQRVELADGDFTDIVWIGENSGPTVLVLHGLEGSIRSHYAGHLLEMLEQAGFRPVFVYFRGCSGEVNRLPRRYHSGETDDLSQVMAEVERATGEAVASVVGFSLGGNVLLKWLGEQGEASPLQSSVAVSVPFRLDDCAKRLERGLSRLYQVHLIGSLKRAFKKKFRTMPCPLEVDPDRLKTFRQWDDLITAPLHGFAGVDDYYDRCSSRQFLQRIRTPTLVIHALDDPFMGEETVPTEAELAPAVTLELSDRGGHVGFVGGPLPWRAEYWLERRITAYLRSTLGGEALPEEGFRQ